MVLETLELDWNSPLVYLLKPHHFASGYYDADKKMAASELMGQK